MSNKNSIQATKLKQTRWPPCPPPYFLTSGCCNAMQYLSDFLLILIIYCCVQSYVASNVLLLCVSYPHWNRLTYSWVQNCAPHSYVHHSFFTSLTLIVNQFKSVKSCERIFFSHLKKKSPLWYTFHTYIEYPLEGNVSNAFGLMSRVS